MVVTTIIYHLYADLSMNWYSRLRIVFDDAELVLLRYILFINK